MSKKKKVTAPLSYDPGKGRPKEYLAYLNWQEMQALQRLNGGNMERGPMGLPSFPPDWRGNPNSTGNWSGAGGTSPGGTQGGSSDSGSRGSESSPSGSDSADAAKTAESQQQAADAAAQQDAANKNAAEAAKTSAFAEDARKAGIGSLNVGPMQTPVKIGAGPISQAVSAPVQSATPPVPTARPSNLGAPNVRAQVAEGIMGVAERLGIDPVDLGTAISYETAGTFDPTKKGQPAKAKKGEQPKKSPWGTHRGLIQFGEPQARQYGVDWKNPVESQLGPGGAVEKYLKDAGVKPGMGLMDVYSAINAGEVGRYNVSDVAAGGAPGTVADKVNQQMAGHRLKAESLLGGYIATAGQMPTVTPTKEIQDRIRTTPALTTSEVSPEEVDSLDPASRAGFENAQQMQQYSPKRGTVKQPTPEEQKRLDMQNQWQGLDLGPQDYDTDQETLDRLASVYEGAGISAIPPSEGVAATVIPSKFGYPTKPDGTPYTAEDIANLPPEVRDEYMNKVRFARQTDVPYPLTDEQREKVFAAKVIGTPILGNSIARGFIGAVNLFGRGLAALPGEAGAIGEEIKYGSERIRDPGEAVADYERANPLRQAQMEEQAGRRPRVGTGTSYVGGTPVQELGGKSDPYSRTSSRTSYSPSGGSISAASDTGRSQQYYLWDLGVGIPSPGEPEYNDYQRYLRERGASAEV
jgi:hypothetical protein